MPLGAQLLASPGRERHEAGGVDLVLGDLEPVAPAGADQEGAAVAAAQRPPCACDVGLERGEG